MLRIRFWILAIVVAGTAFGCSGSKMKPRVAQELLSKPLIFPRENIEIASVSSLGGSYLIEADLRMTFLLQKDSAGKWQVVRVTYKQGEWKDPQKLLEFLALPPFPIATE